MGNSNSTKARRRSSAARRRTESTPELSPRSSVRATKARPRSERKSVDATTQGGIEKGQQAVDETTDQLGYWYLIRHGYESLVNLIIRPPRAQYSLDELGPMEFTLADREFKRTDFQLPVERFGQKMNVQCSHWEPKHRPNAALPCVIYLHGNSSCRLEALSILRCVLASGATLVTMDCIGCGQSDGEYISLGYYERDDVNALIEHLREAGSVSSIALWGRSMGAVTALLHADRDPSIAGIVVDSAFANLEQLVMEIVEHGRREGYTIPTMVVKVALKFIRSSIWKRVRFELKDLSPIDHVDKSFIPALFIAAHKDSFISPQHSEALFEKYAGDKNLIKVAGDHNSTRPQYLLDSISIFLQSVMCIDESYTLHDPFTGTGVPWHQDAMIQRMLQESLADDNSDDGADDDTEESSPWPCSTCTFINLPKRKHCAMCGARAVEPIHLVIEEESNISTDQPTPKPVVRLMSSASSKPPINSTAGDSSVTRLFGSDWGDRRGQSISFTMKIYWGIFGAFMLNGIATKVVGHDEFYYYDMVKAFISTTFIGKPEVTEHEIVAEKEELNPVKEVVVEAIPEETKSQEETPVAAKPIEDDLPATLPTTSSVFASNSAPKQAGNPLSVIPSLQRAPVAQAPPSSAIVTKAQWQQELESLRELEAKCRQELKYGSHRDMDIVSAEIKEIELLKGEIKKRLRQ
ncbi:serine protease family S09X [Thraustotheca clavata]|uniref:Serine protease family S09X n=1 Tax=Thraustotheca clavata TaxID=74557 RepID=A0A1W0A706_9STRA|nr:serine protease family S09X [Thraustotheca clavata]